MYQISPRGDLRKILSSTYKGNHKSDKPSDIIPPKSTSVYFSDTVTLNGKTYQQINVHDHVTYIVSNHKAFSNSSLVDCGANYDLSGSDVLIVFKHTNHRHVDFSGIDILTFQ